jgi:hypothetical protein
MEDAEHISRWLLLHPTLLDESNLSLVFMSTLWSSWGEWGNLIRVYSPLLFIAPGPSLKLVQQLVRISTYRQHIFLKLLAPVVSTDKLILAESALAFLNVGLAVCLRNLS